MAILVTALSDLRTEARALLMESVARMILDSDLNRWANKGINNWSAWVKWYERIVALPVVALNPVIQLPSDLLSLTMIRFQDRGRLRSVDMSTHAERTYGGPGSGNPFRYLNTPKNQRLITTPAPNVGSYVTTLTQNINATQTTLPVASTLNFQLTGRLIIGDPAGVFEQVEYYQTDATDFLLVRRGDGDTVARNWVATDNVTEGKLICYTKAMPPILVNDSDVSLLPTQWIDAIPFFMASMGERKRGDPDKAKELMGEYLRLRDEAVQDALTETADSSEGVKDEEYGMGWIGDI